MNKVLIINPPLFFAEGMPHSIDITVPPLGSLYLASYINKNSKNFRAYVIDVAAENLSLDQMGLLVERLKPFVVGFSSMTPQLQGTVESAKYLKEKLSKKIKFFLGGPHVSADPDFITRFGDIFDYGIGGESEKTFLDSIERLAKNEKIPKMQKGETITDLDTIPFPDKELINRKKYSRQESMMFSRGCPFNCYYCSRPAIDKKVRYRSVENLMEEIRQIYKYCGGRIDFQDDSFTLDKGRVLNFCREVQKEKLKLEWTCNTRIDLVDKELLCEMKKAGCKLIHFGIESGNERVRKEIVNKGEFTNAQIYKVFDLCKKLRIKIGGYFMIGHPGETREDLEDTKSLILNSRIDLLGLSIPTPFPGSKLYEMAEKKGVINKTIIDQFARKELGLGYVGNYPVLISDNLTKEYVFSVMKDINRSFYLNFGMFWNRLKDDFTSAKKIKQDTKDLISLLTKGISSRKPYVDTKRDLSSRG